jgi:hypothetical protein
VEKANDLDMTNELFDSCTVLSAVRRNKPVKWGLNDVDGHERI